MGCGKTAVGRALAARLGCPFHDTDELIERKAGKSVRAIFSDEGEARFRKIESQTLVALAREVERGAVIATGGGLFIDPGNRAWITRHGLSVWLDAPLEELWLRCADEATRPLIKEKAEVTGLLAARRPLYALADVRLDTTGQSPEAIVDALLAILHARSSRPATSEGGSER